MKLSGWGNFPVIDARIHSFRSEDELRGILRETSACIARGLGRSYGDSSLQREVIATGQWNRLLHFDDRTGLLHCQSGVSIADLLDVFVPRGWFPPVVPGTRFVTVGGAIASDIHGKNHHSEGSISSHVPALDLMLANGDIRHCSPEQDAELFWSTCGGMGLTGLILRAKLQMRPIETAYIRQELRPGRNLDEILAHFEDSSSWTYSVAWLDCLAQGRDFGRSILMLGEHAGPAELSHVNADQALCLSAPRTINTPITFPNFALNRLSVRAFNSLYYYRNKSKTGTSLQRYDDFFFPLDAIIGWNRIYGRRGFTQYQFVLPRSAGSEGLATIIRTIGGSSELPFLTVLKLFGSEQPGLLSFPTEGYTLAVDFPITRTLFAFLARLDEIVQGYGGRVYLTKDVRLSAASFRSSYPNAERFAALRHNNDAAAKFSSLQSERLEI